MQYAEDIKNPNKYLTSLQIVLNLNFGYIYTNCLWLQF